MEFKRLSDVMLVEETTEMTNVLVEENGEIKRVPKTKVGGSAGAGGIKTAVIKSEEYDNALQGIAPLMVAPPEEETTTYTCINMTFEEAYQTMTSGEPLCAVVMRVKEGSLVNFIATPLIVLDEEHPWIVITNGSWETDIFWTAEGLSTNYPE